MIREHGLKIVFYVYWIWYITILLLMINEVVLDPRWVKTLNQASYGFLGLGIGLVPFLHLDDFHTKYFGASLFSFAIRTVVQILTNWGMTNYRHIMAFMGFSMIVYFFLEWAHKRDRGDYFKH